MDIIPAIDMINGECVRLIQGQYNRQITYEPDPVKKAREFIEAGAEWLHIVDLDGARVGRPVNTEQIAAIAAMGKLKLEVGGGIRDQASIQQLLDMGVERIIIGTKAVNEFEWFADMAAKFAGKLAIGLDARGSKVATHGWMEDQPFELMDYAIKASKLPLAAIVYTDIDRDGMLSGPNLERTKALADAVDTPVIAAGGMKELKDISNLLDIGGIAAAITGRAIYEGTLDLAEAIKLTKQGSK